VIVAADAEAAEDIIEAQEAGEAAGEDEAIAEANEEATQEATDNAELAAVLRKNGCPAATAAVLKVLLPLDAYGISMPAFEALDATGRNQQLADHIASRLEYAAEGFWESTKKFFRNILLRIQQALNFVWQRLGGYKTRIKRAHDSLQGRRANPDSSNKKQYKEVKNGFDKAVAAWTKVANVLDDQLEVFSSAPTVVDASMFAGICDKLKIESYKEDELKAGVGKKFNSEKTRLEDESGFLETENKDVVDGAVEKYSASSDTSYYGMIDKALDKMKVMANRKDIADKWNKALKSEAKGINDEAQRNNKLKELDEARRSLTICLTVTSATIGAVKKLAMLYVKACSGIRVGTIPTSAID